MGNSLIASVYVFHPFNILLCITCIFCFKYNFKHALYICINTELTFEHLKVQFYSPQFQKLNITFTQNYALNCNNAQPSDLRRWGCFFIGKLPNYDKTLQIYQYWNFYTLMYSPFIDNIHAMLYINQSSLCFTSRALTIFILLLFFFKLFLFMLYR